MAPANAPAPPDATAAAPAVVATGMDRRRLVAIAAVVAGLLGIATAALIVALGGRSQEPDPTSVLAVAPPAASPAGAGVSPTVRIVVPAGKVDLAVQEGDGVHIPLFLALHYPGTGEPGGGTNSLFYAHAQPGMFQGLFSVHPGDEIRAIRADGTEVRFRVTSIHQVRYNDLSVIHSTPFEEITLLTCTTYSPTDPRLIVVGTPET